MTSRVANIALAFSIISLSGFPLLAVQATEFTAGVGAGVAPDYEGSKDYKLVPMWTLKAADLWGKPTYVQLLNTNLRSNFLNDEHWRLGVSGQYVPERSDVQNNAVDNMHGIDASALLGVLAGYDFPLGGGSIFGLDVNARYDVLNSNGYLITPEAIYATPIAENWALSTKVSTTYASEDYMSNYFGVSSSNAARSGLHKFSADAGIKDVSLDVALNWSLAENWGLTFLGQYKRLLSDAADSPITDDKGDPNQLVAGVLVNFHF